MKFYLSSFHDYFIPPRKMRLLNTSTYKLTEFFGNQIPKYVILSHTWGKEEIEYNDLASGNFTKKEGFFKLYQCCRQAFSTGYTYVWIDTCCIDKSSSAELTEAINSMCHWYQNAEVCYAFLEDVGRGDPYDDNSQFRRSRWFTRGWTLQELLFSQAVEFYDMLWQKIEFHTHQNARPKLLS
ncbi:heterokaryon incompatibility protein-domain-containing protein, partial [Xylaria telfairii]